KEMKIDAIPDRKSGDQIGKPQQHSECQDQERKRSRTLGKPQAENGSGIKDHAYRTDDIEPTEITAFRFRYTEIFHHTGPNGFRQRDTLDARYDLFLHFRPMQMTIKKVEQMLNEQYH